MSPNLEYQWEVMNNSRNSEKNIDNWECEFGFKVIERNGDGTVRDVEFTLLVDNPKIRVYLVGDFNNWGKDNLERYELEHGDFSLFAKIRIDFLKHKDKYKYLVVDEIGNRSFREDPSGVFFDDFGNSIFWDYGDPSTYKRKYDFIDSFRRSTKIIQTELPGLITKFKGKDGVVGSNIDEKNYYRFIADSGVIDEIKNLGYNTIQFLPFSQNIDGNNWKFRYLVPFQFAIQKNWGDPDDFAYMIDMFHKSGIAVIGDFVLGHLPHINFEIFGQSWVEHGIHTWKKKDGSYLYLKDDTPWGTMRINFDNHYVRDFFVSSVLHFMKNYRIDGFRIDNIDGILRHGATGQGKERLNGRTFLRELNQSIYSHNKHAMINYEAHYFYGDNAKLLVNPLSSSERSLGASAYNSSRLTYYFHTEVMFKSSDEISIWKFKHISEEKEWGGSNSTIADFHNHDAAAGLMEMRCTGSYAIDAMEHGNVPRYHGIGKIKTMESVISFCCECRTLNLLQTFLLQMGTFEHDSSIDWSLLENDESRKLMEFKRAVNNVMDNEAFWVLNSRRREFLNIDDTNKILVVERSSDRESFIIVINMSPNTFRNYSVGVRDECDYEIVFDSDRGEFGGDMTTNNSSELRNVESNNFELLNREVVLDIGPYNTIVLKKLPKV